MEPGGAPPADGPVEPSLAPPPSAASEPSAAPPGTTFEGESEFAFKKGAFTVNVFGQQLKTETAAKIIAALVVAVVVLVVFVATGDSDGQPLPPPPQQQPSPSYAQPSSSGSEPPLSSTPSLLLSYDFNEGGGSAVLDASGLHHDMDLADERHVGEVSWVSNGICGSALEFFTEDEGACVQTPSFEVRRGITTSLWVWLHSTGGDALWEEQILNCAGGGGSLVLASSAQDDAWRARMWNRDDLNYILPSTGRPVQTNRWVHLAAAFDDTLGATESLVLYVDGIAYKNSEETARLLPNLMKGGRARCTLGCHYWSARNPQYNAEGELIPGKYFDGLVDEMRVWDDYLSQAQIADEQRLDHCTPLLAFWGFNGRSGDTAVDSGPRSLDIDISGGEQFHEVAWAQKGVCGSALEFMADESSPSCVQTGEIPFTEKVTISLWVKLHTIGRSLESYGGIHGGEQVINCHGGGESVLLEASDNADGAAFWRARIYTAAYKSLRVDGAPVAVGQWQHLVLVYDDSQTADPTQQAVLYVDGERYTGDATGYDGAGRPGTGGRQVVWPNRLVHSNPPATCTVGCHGSGRSFFDGLIDEVRLFSGALEPHAVLQDYQHAWCSESMNGAYVLDGLLAFYDFNEGEGNVVSDSAVETGRFAGRHRPSLNLRTLGAMNEVSWETPGLCGAALEFYSVGDNPATLNTPPIVFGEAVTLSVWAFIHTSGATHDTHGGPLGSEQIINCNSNYLLDGTTGFTLALESFPERNAWRARINSQQYADQMQNQGTAALSVEGSLQVNTWTHLAAVFDPTEPPETILKLYVDGVAYTGLDGHGESAGVSNKCGTGGRDGDEWCLPRRWENQLQGTAGSGSTGATSSCAIGGHPSMGAYFDGLIDEVRIFDHALTAGDVAQEATHYWCENMAESQPLLKYNFDEGGGLDVHDQSPYHNDLDISAAEHLGDAAWVSNGVCNSALEFDTQHPDRPGDCLQTAPIPVGRSVTFSMWVYLHDMVPQALQTMHCKNVNRAGGLSENFVFGTNAQQTRWYTRIYSAEIAQECAAANSGENCACGAVDDTSGCGSDNVYGPSDGPNSVQRNQWVHLAATYDESASRDADDVRSQLILYINGDPYYNDNFNRFLPNRLFGGVTCEIGCRIRGDGVTALDFFDGLLDEVQVLERALTAQEIRTELFAMPDCAPLILHLSFNEGSGRTLHDSSPEALHVELDPSSPLSSDTLAGEPGWVKGNDAVCGSALEMMTNGEGDCFTLDAVPFGSAVTISLWARLHSDDASGNGGGAGQIINCHSDGANSGGHTEALVIETRAANADHDGQWQGRTWIQGQGNNPVAADYEMNAWTHLTLVYDDSQDALRQLVLYVNGVPHFGEGTQIWHNMLMMGGGYCSVGCHPAAGADGSPGQAFFDGNIDELRIYNGALNLAAIRNDYQHLWCSHSPPPPPPGSALLLFYPFDEAEGRWVGDYSEHDPPMSIDMEADMTWSPTDPSDVHWITPGVCGSALEFFTNRSGDCLETPSDPALDVGEALSISVWVFLHSVGESLAAHGGPQGSEQVINCHGGMSLVLEAFPHDQVWRVRTYNSNQGDHYVPGANIAPNRWTHLAVVYDPVCNSDTGNDMVCTGPGGDPTAATTLYVDGVPYTGNGISTQHGPDGDGTMPDPMVWRNHLRDSDGVRCTIGCHPGNGGQAFFDGLIDELRIFDRPLSAVEVLETEAQHSWCMRGDRGNNYHYTSFEEPAAPDCACPPDPALLGTAVTGCEAAGQGACKNSFPAALAGRTCLSADSSSGDICEVTTDMSVITGGWANQNPDTEGHYTTNYRAGTNGNAELGFRTFYQSCAAGAEILSRVECTDDSVASIAGNNLGVISMYNVGPNNGGPNVMPPNYNGWGACNEGGTFGAGSHRLPHGEQCFMMDNTRGFAWVELDEVSLTSMSNPVASVWVHLESTGYEESDAIRVWVATRYCGDVEVLSGVLDDEAHPTSIDDSGEEVQIEENQWQRHQVSLAGCGTAKVKFGVQANTGSEEVWFDMVEIRDV